MAKKTTPETPEVTLTIAAEYVLDRPIISALRKIGAKQKAFLTKRTLGQLIVRLQRAAAPLQEERQMIVAAYGTKDKATGEVIYRPSEVSEEDRKAFRKEWDALMATPVDTGLLAKIEVQVTGDSDLEPEEIEAAEQVVEFRLV